MGILNRTPDSFYDRGATFALDDLLRRAEVLVGRGRRPPRRRRGEGRPGPEVDEAEELDRVIPPIEALHARLDVADLVRHLAGVACSTRRARPARSSATTSAASPTPTTSPSRPRHDASVVATHIRLRPRVPDPEPHYDDLLADVTAFLLDRAARAEAAGLDARADRARRRPRPRQDPGDERGAAPRERRARRARLHAAAVGVEQAVPRRAARARDRRPARRVARVGRVRRDARVPDRAGARRRRLGRRCAGSIEAPRSHDRSDRGAAP